MTFTEFIKKCKSCNLCRLRESATQVVPGDGNPKADIMFIGEGPGANEDKEGVPFCGAAGKFLDQLLESIGLLRSDVYITNMVKCRPPGNRDPRDDEMEACRPWLDAQIKYIDPKVMILLGRFAMGKFFPKLKISQAHGRAYKKGKRVYFIMYHPAVALYNGSFREVLTDDMKKVKQILDGDESKVEVVDESSEIAKLLEKKRAEKKKVKNKQMGFNL